MGYRPGCPTTPLTLPAGPSCPTLSTDLALPSASNCISFSADLVLPSAHNPRSSFGGAPCCTLRKAVQRGDVEVAQELLEAHPDWATAWPEHCCSEPVTCAARMLCCCGTLAMMQLLLQHGGGLRAKEALQMIAVGKCPSWRCEKVVAAVMDAMLSMDLKAYASQCS
eukprot:gene14573-20617_t